MSPQPARQPAIEKAQPTGWWQGSRQIVFTFFSILYTYRAVLLLGGLVTLIAVFRDSSMISGLFALNSSDQYWLSLVVTLVGTQIFVIVRILEMHVPARLGFDPHIAGPRLGRLAFMRWVWAFVLAVLPVAIFQYRLYTLPNSNWWGIVRGTLSALALFGGCVLVSNALGEPDSDQVLPIPQLRDKEFSPSWSRKFARRFTKVFCSVVKTLDDTGDGFIKKGKVLPGHVLALFSTCVLIVLYAGAWLVESYLPGLHVGPGYVKAIFYALLTIALSGSTLAFLCFVFDRHRIPIITLLVLVLFGLSLLPTHVHYYEIAPGANPLPVKADALWSGPNDRVVVISAQGGGIQAAAWTTRVLLGIAQQLPERLRRPFVKDVRLVSGVSGGSVGAMFFQTLYNSPGALDQPLPHLGKVHAAGVCGTALSWIGFGLAYYDLLRPVTTLFGYDLEDRGWGAEQAWRKLLQHGLAAPGNSTLHQLRKGVANGTRPLLVFNATIADSGDPLAIANFDLAKDRDFKAFQNLYPNSDLKLTTAVRLSAAFPYVSPSPRPYFRGAPFAKDGYAITDGGLYDNFGVAGAYFTLEQATNYFKETASKPIMWIQIRLPDGSSQETDLLAGTALGPLLTLNNTRVTGQRSRADQLTDLAQNRLGARLQVNKFDYPDRNAPLSWALNPAQIEDIDQGWRDLKDGHEQVAHVCKFLGGTDEECAQAASPWASPSTAKVSSPHEPSVCPEDN
jgi:hypothetical protein